MYKKKVKEQNKILKLHKISNFFPNVVPSESKSESVRIDCINEGLGTTSCDPFETFNSEVLLAVAPYSSKGMNENRTFGILFKIVIETLSHPTDRRNHFKEIF